jgi:hypothetical protein
MLLIPYAWIYMVVEHNLQYTTVGEPGRQSKLQYKIPFQTL